MWSGPGSGKSTIASDLFAEMKWRNYNVELVTETAKELTWEGHHNVLEDQLFVFAMQNRKQERLVNKVDYIITDCPLLLAAAYAPARYDGSFKMMMADMWNQYDNVSYFIKRTKPYHSVGRNQTEQEARVLDNKIKQIMIAENIPFKTIAGDRSAKLLIMMDLGL